MNRRSFLGSILAACAAPAIVRADSLMRIIPMETTVLLQGELGAYGTHIVEGFTGVIHSLNEPLMLWLNGHRWCVPPDVPVQVPEMVAKLIRMSPYAKDVTEITHQTVKRVP